MAVEYPSAEQHQCRRGQRVLSAVRRYGRREAVAQCRCRGPIVVHRGPESNAPVEEALNAHGWEIVACADDDDARAQLCRIAGIVTALEPHERERISERIRANGGTIASTLPTGLGISPQAQFGEGSFVTDGAVYVGSLNSIGRHTIVMTPASIGHDCVIGDFVTIYPSAAISGYVTIEDFVTIGVGAVIVNGNAARRCASVAQRPIAPGAVVTTSVPARAIVSGNPGRMESR